MKVLIWFLCILAVSTVKVLLQSAGIILGAIPTILLYGGGFWLGSTLCKAWDKHKNDKK